MNVIREIQQLNERELNAGILDPSASWHHAYKDSAYVFIGNLDYKLTEGDVITIVSQYGEVEDINLMRDKETGKSKGFAFVKYADQRSTILAVDNLNGFTLLDRMLRVDHVRDYKPPAAAAAAAEGVEPMVAGLQSEERLHDDVQDAGQKATLKRPARTEAGESSPSSEDSDEDPYLRQKRHQEHQKLSAEKKREVLASRLGIDVDDPMRDYLLDQAMAKEEKDKKERKKRRKKEKKHKREKHSPRSERRARERSESKRMRE